MHPRLAALLVSVMAALVADASTISYVFRHGDGLQIRASGPIEEAVRIARTHRGSFLWARHDGREIVIRDAVTLDAVRAAMKPLDELMPALRAAEKSLKPFERRLEELEKEADQLSDLTDESLLERDEHRIETRVREIERRIRAVEAAARPYEEEVERIEAQQEAVEQRVERRIEQIILEAMRQRRD